MLKTLLFLSLLVFVMYFLQTLRLAWALNKDEPDEFDGVLDAFLLINKNGFKPADENYAITVFAHLYLTLTGLYLYCHSERVQESQYTKLLIDYSDDYDRLERYINSIVIPYLLVHSLTQEDYCARIDRYVQCFKEPTIEQTRQGDMILEHYDELLIYLNLPECIITTYCTQRLLDLKEQPLTQGALSIMEQHSKL